MTKRLKKVRRMNKCYWCDRSMVKNDPLYPIRSGLVRTRDHVYPKCDGGTWTVPSCFACNQLKGSMHPTEWDAFRRNNPKWWTMFRVGDP